MKYRTVFRRVAQAEFENAALWYENQRSGLGREFVFEIERALDRAASLPKQFPLALSDVRQVKTRRFPYTIYFRIRDDLCVVLAVFHGRRNPETWKKRVSAGSD